jgi:hypothetical protein
MLDQIIKTVVRMTYVLAFTCISFPAIASAASGIEEGPTGELCAFTREYVTSLEYLRSQKQFSLSDQEGRRLALQVSGGCNGAAERFIKVVSVLTRSELSTRDSIQLGLELAKRTTVEAETFLAVFQKGFLEEYLDMDLRSSLKLARSLSLDFKGDILNVRKDFEKMIEFCSGKNAEGLELSLPRCGDFAARVTKLGEKHDGGSADSFKKLFKFLTTPISGPGLTKSQSLGLAEKVVEFGSTGTDNFIQAYKYAISASGLAMDIQGALEFAKKLSVDLQLEKSKETATKS